MDPRRKSAVTQLLLCVIADLRDEPPENVPEATYRRYQGYAPEQQDRIAVAIDRTVEHLLREEGIKATRTPKNIRDDLNGFVEVALDHSDVDIVPLIDRYVQILGDYPVEWRFFYPLSGLELYDSLPELVVGRVAIYLMTDDRLELERTAMQHRTDNEDEDSGQRVEGYIAMLSLYKDQFVAEVSYTGDLEIGREASEWYVRSVLELLCYSLLFVRHFPVDLKVRGHQIAVQGERETGPRFLVAIPSDLRGSSDRYESGYQAPITLHEDDVEEMEKAGVFILARLLSEPSPRPFDRALLNASHWVADAMTQRDRDNCFLSLMIGLEALFTRGPDDKITQPFAEGVAVVVRDDDAARQELKNRMERLYKRRSKISHGEERGVSDEDLRDAAWVTQTVMRKLVLRRQEFSTLDHFRAWADQERSRTAFYRPPST